MPITIKCQCGKEKVISPSALRTNNYCSIGCKRKYAKRRSGLKYKIVKKNKGWIKKGETPWNKGKRGYMGANKTSFKKGEHRSPDTEFKYKNGKGYRSLIFKGILPKKCAYCNEENIKRLHVHHIDKNRENNNLSNLIVLCRPHHLKIHGRRELNYVEGRKMV